MKRVLGVTFAALAAAVLMGNAARADDAADAKAAIKKLADSTNYSWTSTTENVAAAGGAAGGGRGGGRGGRGGPPAGKAEKDGYTTFTLTIQQQPYDVVLHGTKAVAKLTDGWKTKEDLQKAATAATQAAAGGGGPAGPETQILNQINNFKSPVTQINEIAEKMTNVKKTADGYTADLAADTAKTLATPAARGGRGAAGAAPTPIEVTGAKGTLALTVKDGAATKAVIHLEGSMSFNGQDTAINRNTTLEIKDVGATKQEIPAEAKAKLDSIK